MRSSAIASSFRALVAVGACSAASLGCSSVVESSVAPGSYHNHDVPSAPLGLTVDRAASTVTFTVPGAAPIVRTFVARDREKWPTRCRTNFKAASTELLDLGPAPLQLGAKTFPHPVVLAWCYGRSGSGIEVETMGADGEPSTSALLAFSP